jgi:hypothetical protein
MRELPLLAPQWLQSDQRGRGSHSPLTDCNHGSPHGSHFERVVSLPPLPHWYPLSCWQVWYRTCWAQLGPNPTLGGVVCTKRSSEKVCPLGFRLGRAHILQTQVNPQHLGSENHHSRDTLRSASISRSQICCFELTPCQCTQNAFSCRFYPTHAKNNYYPTHASRSSTYIQTYITLYSSRTIKDRIIKEGSARFISIMHLK